METPVKEKRRYRKIHHPKVTINVDNLVTTVSGRESKTAQELLLLYLHRHRDAVFYNLEGIAKAIREEFNLDDETYAKSTASKAYNNIQGDLKFKDGTYFFTKIDGEYKLRSRFATKDPLLIELFKMKGAFRKSEIFEIRENVFVLSVNPQKIDEVKHGFENLLGPTICFGAMACSDHLVIMLNSTAPKFSDAKMLMKSFFARKLRYEEDEYMRKLNEQAQRAREAEIRRTRQKYKNHNLTHVEKT